ncbi:MAG: hypothetical protein JOY59_12825 [Candidatus Eremiobacteraeota bacterium]|nr:hypothetical protein [Candidatus Eremiobacteraeota bacterium]
MLAAAAVVELTLGHVAGWLPLGIWAVLAVLLIAFERMRYRPRVDRNATWVATNERFTDPATGVPMQVYENPQTGARDYRPIR